MSVRGHVLLNCEECISLSFSYHIGPILDDKLKEKILKPLKGVLCIHFHVSVGVYVSVHGLQSTPFDLGT